MAKNKLVVNSDTEENSGPPTKRQLRHKRKDKRFSLRIGTWNIQTMLQAGKMTEIGRELIKYNLDLIALQEIRWQGTGSIDKGDYAVYYSCADKQGHHGTGFIINRKLKHCVLSFEPFNERLCRLRIKGKLHNTTFICVYSPTEDSTEDMKESSYENLQNLCETVSKHDALIVLGDLNARVGKEDIYTDVIGKHSLHDETSDNGERLCNFAAANDLFICGTKFPHKNIHKGTWKVPGRSQCNQIDHILVNKRRLSCVQDVRVFRGANCDSDHFLVVASLRNKTSRVQNNKGQKRLKWDVNKLHNPANATLYKQEVANNLNNNPSSENVEEDWRSIKISVIDAAKTVIGERKLRKGEEWFDEEYCEAINIKNEARLKYIQSDTDENKESYMRERTKCRKMARRKKRDEDNNKINNMEDLREKNLSRYFYREINNHRKGYQPRTSSCREKSGTLLSVKTDVIKRWREYFEELYNVSVNNATTSVPTFFDAEEELSVPTLSDVKESLRSLKNNKAPGLDTITSELLKRGGDELLLRLYKLVLNIWVEEKMPQEWNMGITVPILKKGDKTVCDNYRGISVLSVAYKLFSGVLYKRLSIYAEEILGEYQCGFRPNRSTTDHIHLMRQLLEKAYEYNINLHHIFIDFKQAFDSVNRSQIFSCMLLLGIPSKLVRLVKTTLEHSQSVVAIQNEFSEPFSIYTGVKQGDALSTLIFNLVLEAVIRKVNVTGLIDYNTSQLAAYADDVVITSRSKNRMIDHCLNLKMEAEKFGLKVNVDKTKYLATTRKPDQPHNIIVSNNCFEGVDSFKYLGSILTSQNNTEEEIKARVLAGNKCFYSCKKLLTSKLLSRKSKLTIYRTIIRPVVTYACETWTLTQRDELKLAVFERKVLRTIFGPVRESDGTYRQRMNHELDTLINRETIVRYCKSQRLRWAGHLERMPDKRAVKIINRWTPQQKRPKGRPKKRWMECVEQDLRGMGKFTNWRRQTKDRDTWKKTVEEARTHKGL